MDHMYDEMLRFWKFSWDTYKTSLARMQEQGESVLDIVFSQSQNIQEGTKKNLRELMAAAQKAQSVYIQTMEDTFQKIEQILSRR